MDGTPYWGYFCMSRDVLKSFKTGCKIIFNQTTKEFSEDVNLEPTKTLTVEEVLDVMLNMGWDLSVSDRVQKLGMKQPNITFPDFLKVVAAFLTKKEAIKSSGQSGMSKMILDSFRLAVQGLREMFNIQDGDGNGFITVKELQKAFSVKIGKEAIQHIDKDGDGQLNWNEFRDQLLEELLDEILVVDETEV